MEQIKKTTKRINKNGAEKYYKYKCLICGNIDIIYEYHLNEKCGCNVCANLKVLKGYNDLWTTHPQIAQMLKYADKGYQVTFGSDVKQIFICKNCGFEKSESVSHISSFGKPLYYHSKRYGLL